MTAHTKMSAKGQVVIPKDVRDRLGLTEGVVLDVIETDGGVILRKPAERKKLSVDEAVRELRKIHRHEGPPVSIERLSWSAEVDRAYDERRADDVR